MTPGQTIGPFYGYALPYDGDSQLVPPSHPQAIRLHGTVRDGNGAPVPDALLEIWQADAEGNVVRVEGSLKRDGYTFTGWGRAATDDNGSYTFTTITPGASAGGVPFIAMTVFARGLLDGLFTRVYLPDHGSDALLSSVPEGRRGTLVARRDRHGLVFDVALQGEAETVFLSYPRA
ncbi:MAG: protocatechuate 3,4-dioxygenase subunit alpha [Nocardioidaceae bacterium]